MGNDNRRSGGIRISVNGCRGIANVEWRNREAAASGFQLPDAKRDERNRKNPDQHSHT